MTTGPAVLARSLAKHAMIIPVAFLDLGLIQAQTVDLVAEKAITRCESFGFIKGTPAFATCASEQAAAISSAESVVSSETGKSENDSPPEMPAAAEAIEQRPAVTTNVTQADAQGNHTAENKKFIGTGSVSRSATIVPTGAIEVDVQSNKGGAAMFGVLGAIIENAATSGQSQSDESVIANYVTATDTDPRIRFASLLAEYLTSCFTETEAYNRVVQPLLGVKAWRLKEKRLDETRYEGIPTTNFIIETKLEYSVNKTLLGTQLMIPINVSIFRAEDRKEVKRFSAVPNKLFGEFSALDGVAELGVPTNDVLRDGAMKISNKICKAKI